MFVSVTEHTYFSVACNAVCCCNRCVWVQVNGKMRGTVNVSVDIDQDGAMQLAKGLESVQKQTDGKDVKKVIFVPGKILNIIAK